MSEGIEGKINCRVRQRFYQVLWIKRKFCSQPKRTWTAPFFEPVYSVNQIVVKSLTIAFELRLHIIEDLFLPLFMTVVNVPLFAISNHTFISRSGNNLSSRFEILQSVIRIYQLFSDQVLSVCYFCSLVISNDHSSFVKSFFVTLFFSLIQQSTIILTFNLQVFANF